MKELFYKFVTRPLAKVIDYLDVDKRRRIQAKRDALALKNKFDLLFAYALKLIEIYNNNQKREVKDEIKIKMD